MKIALLGYGKMGRLIESLALREGWEVGARLDINDNQEGAGITSSSMAGIDVALDFSQPDAVIHNIAAVARVGTNIVVGTTGWADQQDRIRKIILESGIGLVYASNFSVGMNLFFAIVSHSAKIIGRTSQYDLFLSEQHHSAKMDAPSGTALNLLDLVRPHMPDSNPDVAVTRAGYIPGNHVVGFDSEADTILLEHRARSRQGFAEGAILAARWVAGKKGFFDFRDVFREIIRLDE